MGMEAIRIHKIVTDDRVEEIKKFIGKRVEIIIFPEDLEEEKENVKENPLFAYRGSCPDIIDGMEFQNKVRKEWER
jgi:hypothetical protein